MNRTLKRVLGLTGSVMLGLAGAVTFASAAQAHHVTYSGVPECTDDGWIVKWEATDWEGKPADIKGYVASYEANGSLTGNLAVADAELPEFGSSTPLTGTQMMTLDDETATLILNGRWDNGQTNEGTPVTVSQPDGGCEGEPADPEPVTAVGSEVDCVGIWVWAENQNPEALEEFTFVSSDGEEVSGTPEVGDTFSHYFLLDEAADALTVEVYAGEELVDTIEWTSNELCSYVSVEADCEGLIFTLTVPADGEAATFELWTSLSEEPITVELAPGESETHTFKAVGDEELWVDYYIETQKDATYGGVQWIPCDEETPSPSETPSAQPQLPTTGSSMTIMIGSAAALIVAAAAIFLIMRRRRAAQDW